MKNFNKLFYALFLLVMILLINNQAKSSCPAGYTGTTITLNSGTNCQYTVSLCYKCDPTLVGIDVIIDSYSLNPLYNSSCGPVATYSVLENWALNNWASLCGIENCEDGVFTITINTPVCINKSKNS